MELTDEALCQRVANGDEAAFDLLVARYQERAYRLARACDLMIAMGSTLQVHPAAEIPLTAKRSGARLAIATLSETPLDALADVVVNLRIGVLMERLGVLEPGEAT